MDNSLLLGLPILLCCFRVLYGSFADKEHGIHELFVGEYHIPVIEIIQCRMCHLQFPGEKCSRGRGICTATMEEACTTGRIFRNDGTPWLTFRGCLKNCADVNNIWSVYLANFRCCRRRGLCNEDL
uniref:Prostate and testis expressed 1 n=1 Tax=Phocoena sinus TaxID=42100 RepID=A0A8C9E4A0_PHOSS